MSAARPVRVAKDGGGAGRTRVVRIAPRPAPDPGPTGGAVETRENRGASTRARRLAVLYAVAILAVFGALAVAAGMGPAGSGAGTAVAVELVGAVAGLLLVVGVVVSLGSAPRRVVLGPSETVVVGRFGRTYRFPGRDELRVTVLQRVAPGWLSRSALESVELTGGTTRRSFLVDEGLFARGPAGDLPSAG